MRKSGFVNAFHKTPILLKSTYYTKKCEDRTCKRLLSFVTIGALIVYIIAGVDAKALHA